MPEQEKLTPAGYPALPAATQWRLLRFWLIFCIVKIGGATLLYGLYNKGELWHPVLWEGSSMLVGSLTIGLHWWLTRHTRQLVGQPWRWLWANLRFLPLWCLLFTPLTYGIRHAVYGLLGQTYQHAEWSGILVYESLQYSLFFILWLGIVFALTGQDRLRHEQAQRKEIALALREAHLALLRQQLQPHFLFNALNLISATMYEDVPKADALLRHLANLLRQAIASTHQASHSLHDELVLLRDYAAIMSARFEGRVTLDWQIDAALETSRLPAMIAQPLLENAFKYGVEPFSTPSQLKLHVDAPEAGRLRLRVSQDHGRYEPGTGHGLQNIRQRLAAHYDSHASLELANLEPEGVCATLMLPCAS